MKTSKIILISYLSLIGLLFLSFAITTGHRGFADWKIEKQEEIIPDIRFIRLADGSRLNVEKGNTPAMAIEYLKDSVKRPLPYRFSGDTLIMESWEHFRYYTSFTVYTDKIERVETRGGKVFLSLQQDSLEIVGQNKGTEIHLRKSSEIDHINALLKDHARFHITESVINRINITTDNSFANCDVPVKEVVLKATNQSEIYLNDVMHLQSERDETSRLFVR